MHQTLSSDVSELKPVPNAGDLATHNTSSSFSDNTVRNLYNYISNKNKGSNKLPHRMLNKKLSHSIKISSKKNIAKSSSKDFNQNKSTKIAGNKSNIIQLTDKNEKTGQEILKKLDSFCSICNVECGSTELLQEHKEDRMFICRVCTQECGNHDELELHYRSVHKSYKCNICLAVFVSRKDLFEHKNTIHQPEKITCETCNEKFANRHTLRNHINTKHTDHANEYLCNICGKTFFKSSLWLFHMRSKHTAYKHIECKFCQNLFLGPKRLAEHIKANHIESGDVKYVCCKTCGKMFKSMYFLSRHQQTHDNTVIMCTICGQSVQGKASMRSHMNIKHSKTGTFTCKTCSEQFDTRIKLNRHRGKFHRNRNAPVFCEICGKQFKTSTILKNHKAVHFDEKPFVCEVCGASFKFLVALKNHSRVHSNIGKYNCGTCDMSFKWKQTFDNHKKKCSPLVDNVKKSE